MIGYLVLVIDNTYYFPGKWVITKGGFAKNLDSYVTFKDCYSGTAGANSMITRMTLGGTDCLNCSYKVVKVDFSEKSSYKVSDILNI